MWAMCTMVASKSNCKRRSDKRSRNGWKSTWIWCNSTGTQCFTRSTSSEIQSQWWQFKCSCCSLVFFFLFYYLYLYQYSSMWWWWIEFCLLIYTILWKYESIFDGHLFHLRAKCQSRLTPIVIFKIGIDEMCTARFVSRDKCLRSILPVRVELKYFLSLLRPLISFFFVCKFNCPIRVNGPFCYCCCCLINTVGVRTTLSDKREMRSSWIQGPCPQWTKRKVLILDITPH
jgi:hypothetical protein